MASGYDVCVVKEGFWVVYSFFDESEEVEALYLANDIKNNYKEVCVLFAKEMGVIYHHAKDPKAKKPSYLDVRTNIKLAKDAKKKKTAPFKPKAAKPMPAPPPQPRGVSSQSVKEDEFYTKKDRNRTMVNTLSIAFLGTLLSITIPLFIHFDSSTRMAVMFILLAATASLSVLTFRLSETSARKHNADKSIDSPTIWEDIQSSDFAKETSGYTLNQKRIEEETEQSLQDEIKLPSTPPLSTTSKGNAEEYQEKEKQNEPNKAGEGWVTLPEIDLSAGLNIPSTEEVAENAETYFSTSEDDLEDADENAPQDPLNTLLEKMCEQAKALAWDAEAETLKDDLSFAFTLYIAGATTKALDLQNAQPSKLYKEAPLALTALNMNPHLVESYLTQLKEYLMYPQYMATFRHGENDAASYFNAGIDPASIEKAFALWSGESVEEVEEDYESEHTFVMFTDIVSFTENTRVLGQEWMKDIIRAHNDIMRKVLAEYNGTEIKHTGDGILSTFSSAQESADAALSFQTSIDRFNTALPNREFHVRIGISYGEIIKLDNDIFGEPVNLAARLMQHCSGDQIVLSTSAKDLLQNREGITLTEIQNVSLKGFEAQSIYSLATQG